MKKLDKTTTKIVLVSLVLALIWLMPVFKEEINLFVIMLAVLVRTFIIFAFIRFLLFLFGKKKSKK